MEIIDELEPVTRGPYTGALVIWASIAKASLPSPSARRFASRGGPGFTPGAGIVADSVPAATEETLAKAAGFAAALDLSRTAVFAP